MMYCWKRDYLLFSKTNRQTNICETCSGFHQFEKYIIYVFIYIYIYELIAVLMFLSTMINKRFYQKLKNKIDKCFEIQNLIEKIKKNFIPNIHKQQPYIQFPNINKQIGI
jgi:hypothetical protein